MIKMEKELKEKIFASYLGSVDIKYEGSDVPRKLNISELSICSHVIDECKLQVKSLSIISDADAILVCELTHPNSYDYAESNVAIEEGRRIVWWVNDRGFSRIVYQYLQSQGYALPWRGLSVEDLIKSGVYEF
jgi:hypothetical protein